MKFRSGRWVLSCALLLPMSLLVACGGGGSSAGTGTVNVAMTDAPSCGYDSVNVTVQKIRMNTSATASSTDGGWTELVLNPARRINLLDLQNGVLDDLGSVSIPAGRVQQVRLVLAANSSSAPLANSVVLSSDQSEHALTTPSGQTSGTKINVDFTVPEGQTADLLLDFDACKSVVQAGNSGNYNLKPVVAAIPRLNSGLTGYVDMASATGNTLIALQQNGVTVRATTPIQTGDVGKFTLSPVQPGTYDLVVTAPGKTMVVVTDVVIQSGGLTNLDPTPNDTVKDNQITLVASGTANLKGTVTNTVSSTADTFIDASQALSSTKTVGLTGAQLGLMAGSGSSGSASYSFDLPVQPPLVAPYASTLTYAPATSAGGRFTLTARSGSGASQVVQVPTPSMANPNPAPLVAGATVQTDFTFNQP